MNIDVGKSYVDLEYFYNLILKKTFEGNVNNKEYELFLQVFNKAYFHMKEAFKSKKRKGKGDVPYFEHLKGVLDIYLNYFENISKEAVLIAILHDSIEDINNIDYNLLKKEYGEDVAIAVLAISKREKIDYLSLYNANTNNKLLESDYYNLEESEKKLLDKELKKLRNEDYFGHMMSFSLMKKYVEELLNTKNIEFDDSKLEEITNNVIFIKIADRLHNLKDMLILLKESDRNDIEDNVKFIERKLEETNKFFINIVKEKSTYNFYTEFKNTILLLEKEIIKALSRKNITY